MTRTLIRSACITVCMFLSAAGSQAQDYPNRPVRLIVPFPAGGPSDVIARTVADRLTSSEGIRVIVENRAGAGGAVGVDHVSKAVPDGYTLVFTPLGPIAISPHLRPDFPYDPIKNLAPVAHLADLYPIYAINPAIPAKTMKEFAALAHAKPNVYSLASTGVGSSVHIAIELFKAAAKAEILHVPYAGAAPALTDTLGGQVSGVVIDVSALMPYLRSGKLRALATATPQRTALLPDVPTMAEAGYPQTDAVNWVAIFAPANTPSDIVQKLHAAINRVLAAPAVREKFLSMGVVTKPMATPAEFGNYVRAEYTRWGQRIRERGIKSE